MGIPFVVHGAEVRCDCGSSSTTLKAMDGRSKIGSERYMIDIDTSKSENFAGNFGICSSAYKFGKACSPSFLPHWFQPEKHIVYKNIRLQKRSQEFRKQTQEIQTLLVMQLGDIAALYESQSNFDVRYTGFLPSIEQYHQSVHQMDGSCDISDFADVAAQLRAYKQELQNYVAKATINQYGMDYNNLDADALSRIADIEKGLDEIERKINTLVRSANRLLSEPLSQGHPLLETSVLICTHGGVVYIDTTGQSGDYLNTMDDSLEASLLIDTYHDNDVDPAGSGGVKDISTLKYSMVEKAVGLQRSIAVYLGYDFTNYFTDYLGQEISKGVLEFLEKKVKIIFGYDISDAHKKEHPGKYFPPNSGVLGTLPSLSAQWNTIHAGATSLKVFAVHAHGSRTGFRITYGNIPSLSNFRVETSTIGPLLTSGPTIERVLLLPCHNGQQPSTGATGSSTSFYNLAEAASAALPGVPCIAGDGYVYMIPSRAGSSKSDHPVGLEVYTDEYTEAVETDASGNTLYHSDGVTPQKRKTFKSCEGFVAYKDASLTRNILMTASTGKESPSYIIGIDTYPGSPGRHVVAESLLRRADSIK